jgi:hypothetical protein
LALAGVAAIVTLSSTEADGRHAAARGKS